MVQAGARPACQHKTLSQTRETHSHPAFLQDLSPFPPLPWVGSDCPLQQSTGPCVSRAEPAGGVCVTRVRCSTGACG